VAETYEGRDDMEPKIKRSEWNRLEKLIQEQKKATTQEREKRNERSLLANSFRSFRKC